MSIKAVVFDLGGVLTKPVGPSLELWARSCGTTAVDLLGLLLDGYGEVGDTERPWHRLERGESTLAEVQLWADHEGSRRGWKIDLAGMAEIMSEPFLRPALIERAAALRAAGVPTALISNNVREWDRHMLEALPLDELFEVKVMSWDVGLRKPDPRIFQLALERLGVEPDEAVMLDDFEVNVTGARAVGMHAILVGDDDKEVLAQLDELLPLPPPPGPHRP